MRRGCVVRMIALVAWGVCLGGMGGCATAEAAPRGDGPMGRAISGVLARDAIGGAQVGAVVRRVKDGRAIFARHADEPMEMASNAKLFTTAAALWKLGREYRFKTAVIANGRVEDGRLLGDLVVVGGGDPCISGRLYGGKALFVPRRMAEELRRFRIAEVTGDLVMDDRLFDREYWPAGWPESDRLWWYAAPISALSFNDNCVDITVRGGATPGRAAAVRVGPRVGYARVVNRAVTCGRKTPNMLGFERGDDGGIVISGRIRVGDVRGEHVTVRHPPLYLAAAIVKELARAGIALKGRARLVRTGERARPEARQVYVWETPLVEAIRVANRRSQNFFAEQILKTMGAEHAGRGTTKSGLAVVAAFTATIPGAAGRVRMMDGCGLSPGNRATPGAIAALLCAMYASASREVYYNSLAVSGEAETTLRHRLNDALARGRVHAKTGTIKGRGVSACSGYIEARDGEVYAFSILVNGVRPDGLHEAKRLEDSICRAVLGVSDKALRRSE